MHYSLFGFLRVIASVVLIWLVVGCGEDPRYAAKTPYMGGVYGGEQAGAPRDSVSYWDGDNVNGSPSVKISLGEQRAYFYKAGVLVGVSQLSTGREGLNTPIGTYKIIQKDKDHVSSLFGDYVDSSGKVVVRPLSKSTSRSRSPPSSTWIPVRSAGGVLDTIGSSTSAPHAPGVVGHGLAARPSGMTLISSDGLVFGGAGAGPVEARRTIRVTTASRISPHPAIRRPRLEAFPTSRSSS